MDAISHASGDIKSRIFPLLSCFFITKLLLLKLSFMVKIFLRILLILSYLFVFLSKEQKACYVHRWNLLTEGLHCRTVRWGSDQRVVVSML